MSSLYSVRLRLDRGVNVRGAEGAPSPGALDPRALGATSEIDDAAEAIAARVRRQTEVYGEQLEAARRELHHLQTLRAQAERDATAGQTDDLEGDDRQGHRYFNESVDPSRR